MDLKYYTGSTHLEEVVNCYQPPGGRQLFRQVVGQHRVQKGYLFTLEEVPVLSIMPGPDYNVCRSETLVLS